MPIASTPHFDLKAICLEQLLGVRKIRGAHPKDRRGSGEPPITRDQLAYLLDDFF